MTIIAVTGHRFPRLKLDYSENSEKILTDFCVSCLTNHVNNCGEIITGMAGGFDMCMAKASLLLGIPFTAALAFDGQADTWPDDARSRWQGLLSKANEVIVASDGKAENYKYLLRDEMMVNMGDHVIALWDGDKKGGTAYTVKYALKEGLPVTNYWDKWMSRKG